MVTFMNNALNKELTNLTQVLRELRDQKVTEFDWLKSHSGFATKQDLKVMEEHLIMKLTEIKAQIAQAASRSTEAFTEVNARLVELQNQVDALVVAATDPDVTDEKFLADLQLIKTNTDALADIVPAPVPPAARR